MIAGAPAAILDHEVALEMKAMHALKMSEWKDQSMSPQRPPWQPGTAHLQSSVTEEQTSTLLKQLLFCGFCYVQPNLMLTNQEIHFLSSSK